MHIPFALAAETAVSRFPFALVSGVTAAIGIVVVLSIVISRARKAHGAAAVEPGTILTITTFPARSVVQQVEALRAVFGASTTPVPKSGYARPIAVLDGAELRMTAKGTRDTTYLAVPRSAIASTEIVDIRERFVKARAIRVWVNANGTLSPLDLLVMDPKNPTNVNAAHLDSVFAQLTAELAGASSAP